MRSRERLAETLRSINPLVYDRQSNSPIAGSVTEFFNYVADLVANGNGDQLVQAELYCIQTTSPHYQELIEEAREYLGRPF